MLQSFTDLSSQDCVNNPEIMISEFIFWGKQKVNKTFKDEVRFKNVLNVFIVISKHNTL